MKQELLQIILQTAQASFIDVATFVGAILLVFGLINYKSQGKLLQTIKEKKKWQPLIGAILGLTPGCGGAILIMPLYVKKSVTFGTVIATLVATAGDSVFVLMSKEPITFLKVTAITFITGIISGYLIDILGIQVKRSKNKDEKTHPKTHDLNIKHIGHEEGDPIDLKLHHESLHHHQKKGTLGYKLTHNGYIFYWLILLIGLPLGFLNLFQIVPLPEITLYLGVVGALFSIMLMLAGKKFLADETHEEEEIKLMSIKETLVHSAQDVAFVGTLVFIAFLAYEIFAYTAGLGELGGITDTAGLWSVITGSAVGIIPVCSPQIIFVSIYTKGLLPFAALVANSISQDGDALLPLLAMDKRAALVATIITTGVGLAVGLLFYFII